MDDSPNSKMNNHETIDEVVARFGTYLHMLADRTSHYYCTNSKDTYLKPVNQTDF